MLFVIGASSLDRAIKVAKHPIQKRLAGKYFTVGGLGFHSNNRKPLRILLRLLVRGSLRNKSSLVNWREVIRNTINAHHSNFDEPCTAEELHEIIEPFKHWVSAILYARRRRGTGIFERLLELKTENLTLINVRKHLISKRKNKRKFSTRRDRKSSSLFCTGTTTVVYVGAVQPGGGGVRTPMY